MLSLPFACSHLCLSFGVQTFIMLPVFAGSKFAVFLSSVFLFAVFCIPNVMDSVFIPCCFIMSVLLASTSCYGSCFSAHLHVALWPGGLWSMRSSYFLTLSRCLVRHYRHLGHRDSRVFDLKASDECRCLLSAFRLVFLTCRSCCGSDSMITWHLVAWTCMAPYTYDLSGRKGFFIIKENPGNTPLGFNRWFCRGYRCGSQSRDRPLTRMEAPIGKSAWCPVTFLLQRSLENRKFLQLLITNCGPYLISKLHDPPTVLCTSYNGFFSSLPRIQYCLL